MSHQINFGLVVGVGLALSGLGISASYAQTTPPTGGTAAAPSTTGTPSVDAGQATTNPSEFLIGNAVSDASSPQYQDVADAITRFRNNDVSGARELLARARQNNQKLPPVEIMMARLWAVSNQLNNFHVELEKAVMTYPDDPDAYLYLAELALAEHRVTDAESDLMRAKDLIAKYQANQKRKRNFDIRYNASMAAVAEERTQWSEAMPHLEAWLKLDPDNAAAHARMGRALFQMGRPTDAYNEYDAALKIDPKSINPYIALAGLYEQTKDRTNAAKSISYAVQKNPKDLNVHLQAARWGLATNQLNEAQKYADDALKIDPDSLEGKILRGIVARMTGDMKTAETRLQAAVVQAPANIDASNQLALVLIESPDKDKRDRAAQIAEYNLRATTQNGRTNPEVAATYAWVLYKLGKTAEAGQILAQIQQAGNISPDTAFYIAKILEDQDKIDGAIYVCEKALESPVPFAQRQATADLLDKLKKKKDAKDKGGSPAPTSDKK
jgi:tetratricopeptide (TPR) repeat protein